MGSLVLLLKFIFLLKIILQIKCSDLEATSSVTPPSSTSNASDTEVVMYMMNNVNDTEYNSTKDELNSTINLGEPFGLTIETRLKRESSAEKKLKEDVKNDTESGKASAMTEETIQEMFLEPWGRVRRDNDDEEPSDTESSDGSSQNQNSCGSSGHEVVLNESSSESEGKNLNEAESDDGDDPSNGSSEQLDPEDTSSMDEEVREERNVGEAEESLEKGEYRYRTRPYWYRESIFRRYWTSHERKPSRDFIRIPIFPGK